jgi:hypothetical protein
VVDTFVFEIDNMAWREYVISKKKLVAAIGEVDRGQDVTMETRGELAPPRA